jgi:pseudaminic acid synthase
MHMIDLGGHKIGKDYPPFVIAELSANHGQSLEKALRLVDAAARAGVQALKLQTYTADTMTLDLREGDFFIDDPASLWCGYSLYELYAKAYTPWEWHKPIFDRARQHGMVAFSTPFDETAVDFLEQLDVPAYKIASFENGDIPLIRKVSRTGKPVIMSTGTATLEELTEGVAAAREAGCRDLILLKCTSSYPARPEDAHLRTLMDLEQRFDCIVGISDHTLQTATSVAAVSLGGCVVEKHFVLDRAENDIDAAFSLEPDEMARMVEDVRTAWASLGRVSYDLSQREALSRRHRRSLYVCQDIRAGERFTTVNVRAIRPGAGLSPGQLPAVIGAVCTRDVRKGEPLSLDMVSP